MTVKFDQFYTAQEVAKRLRVSLSYVYALGQKRQIPVTHIGGRLVFNVSDIEAYLTRRTTGLQEARALRQAIESRKEDE